MSWSRKRVEVRQCGVDGCPRDYYAKGWCHNHYYRARRHNGDPLAFTRIPDGERFTADGRRWCSRCREHLPPEQFNEVNTSWCKRCRWLARYGITKEQFAVLPGADGTCPLCLRRPSICLDHDHSCCPGRQGCGKCTRGVLCRSCNQALGTLTDAGTLRAAVYLAA